MIRGSLPYFAIRGCNGLLSIATLFVLTRILTAEEYGIYTLCVTGAATLAAVSSQWITLAVARLDAAYSAVSDVVLHQARDLLRVVDCVIVGAALLALPLYSIVGWSPHALAVVALGALAFSHHSLNLQIFNTRGRPLGYGALSLLRALLALIGAGGLVFAGLGGMGAALGVGLATTLAAAVFGWRFGSERVVEVPGLRMEMVKYGVPLAFASLATIVIDVSDRFMIAWWHGPTEVSGYAAAYDLSQQTVGVLLNVFFLALFPKITVAWETKDIEKAKALMQSIFRCLIVSGPFICIAFLTLSDTISLLVFGEGIRQDSASIMPWVAAAIIVGCIKNYFLDIPHKLTKSVSLQLQIVAAMAAINIVLNCLLIPKFGALGGAIATLIAFLSGAALSWKKGRHARLYPKAWPDIIKGFCSIPIVVLTTGSLPTDMFMHPYGDYLDSATKALVMTATYVVFAMLTNLGGLRTFVFFSLMSRRS